MDLIVDLIDQLIEERIRIALSDYNWNGRDETKAIVLKERLRRLLNENLQCK